MNGMVVYKMTGSGNDFVMIDGRNWEGREWPAEWIRYVCDRRVGVGADGLAVLRPGSGQNRVNFTFFNSDGSPAPMCGNGSLCATTLAARLEMAEPDGMELETEAGVFRSRCREGPGQRAEIWLDSFRGEKVDAVEMEPEETEIYRAVVGVPHLVVLVSDVAEVDLMRRGAELRYHPSAGPGGANVNFVARGGPSWAMRTYERGVEGETFACGTGAMAAAALLAEQGAIELPWRVQTASNYDLEINGRPDGHLGLSEPSLVGEGRLVFRGVLEDVGVKPSVPR